MNGREGIQGRLRALRLLLSQKSHQVCTRSLEIGVTKIAVEKVEQWLQPLNAEGGVTSRR
jgi:hypothetical protein